MEAKHTQGPWEFANANTVLVGPKIDDKPIWLRPVVLRAETAIRADDAALIAAAPDLLAALQAFSDFVRDEACATDGPVKYSASQITALAFMAREAIAKALPPNASSTTT